jgi:ABC-type multidrug transport system ATPase subunit
MIAARELSLRFGRHRVLRDITLSVQPGERVALLGLNGAGKTSLIRCMLGLVPFEGQLAVAGYDVRREGLRARHSLGYVPQRAPAFDGTLEEVLAFFSRLRGIDPAEVEQRLAALGLDLAGHAAKPVRALSGGMLQKLLLALALAARVRLLLLDEPTANLDPAARREFLKALSAVDGETTILLASHRLSDVQAVASRLLVLHHGRLAFDGRLQDLRQAVEAASTLWLEIPRACREAAARRLAAQYPDALVKSNGNGLGLRIPPRERAAALGALREAGIAVENLWTEAPSLHDILASTLGLDTPPEEGASP